MSFEDINCWSSMPVEMRAAFLLREPVHLDSGRLRTFQMKSRGGTT
jgi:hypothetical protein